MWLTQEITEYANTSEIASVQTNLRCCGVDGPKDWQANDLFNYSSNTTGCGVPLSCFIDQSNISCGFDSWQNGTASSNIRQEGCVEICVDLTGVVMLFFSFCVTLLYNLVLFLQTKSDVWIAWIEMVPCQLLCCRYTNSSLALCLNRTETVDSGVPDQENIREVFPAADDSSSLNADSEATETDNTHTANTWRSKGWRLLCLCYWFRKRFRSSQSPPSDCKEQNVEIDATGLCDSLYCV